MFKIGDKVRYIPNGDEGVVTQITKMGDPFPVLIYWKDRGSSWHKEESNLLLKRIEAKKKKKKKAIYAIVSPTDSKINLSKAEVLEALEEEYPYGSLVLKFKRGRITKMRKRVSSEVVLQEVE